MLMIRGAASLLLVIHLLLCVHSIDQGTVIKAHPDAPSAVVAIWSDGSSGATPVRCTGVFVAPEVVLTAASCILSRCGATCSVTTPTTATSYSTR